MSTIKTLLPATMLVCTWVCSLTWSAPAGHHVGMHSGVLPNMVSSVSSRLLRGLRFGAHHHGLGSPQSKLIEGLEWTSRALAKPILVFHAFAAVDVRVEAFEAVHRKGESLSYLLA